MFCLKCGKENSEQLKFCGNCGAQLKAAVKKTSARKKKNVLWMVALAVIAVMTIGVGVLGMRKIGLISKQTASDNLTASDENNSGKTNYEDVVTTKPSEVLKIPEKENEKNSMTGMEHKESDDEKMKEVIFEDPLVERCVRETLGKGDDEKITVADCESIESLLIDCQMDVSFQFDYSTGQVSAGNYIDLCDLRYLSELQELYIDNSIASDYLANLDAVVNCKKLRKWYMEYDSSTYFYGGEMARGYKYLAQIVKQLPELEYLDLGYYVIDDFAKVLKQGNMSLNLNKREIYRNDYNVERLREDGSYGCRPRWKIMGELEQYNTGMVYYYNESRGDEEGEFVDREPLVGVKIESEEELREIITALPDNTEDIIIGLRNLDIDLDMGIFNKFKNLKSLSISGKYYPAKGLDGNRVEIINIDALQENESLFSVNFEGCNGDYKGIEKIKGIKELSFIGCKIDEADFLGNMKELRELTLLYCDNELGTLEDSMKKNYSKFENLKYLYSDTKTSLSGIEKNSTLEALRVVFREDNGTLENVGECITLKSLNVLMKGKNTTVIELLPLNQLLELEMLWIDKTLHTDTKILNIGAILQLPNIVSVKMPMDGYNSELNEYIVQEINSLLEIAAQSNSLSYFSPMETAFWGYVDGYARQIDYLVRENPNLSRREMENAQEVKLIKIIDFEKMYTNNIYDNMVQQRMELNPTEPLSFEEAYEHYFFHYQGVSDIEEVGILGVWDSIDGEIRLIFESTGADFTVTNEGVEYANGTVQVINFATGKKDFAEYIIDGDSIILAHDLEKNRYAFSYENGAMIIHEDYFYKVDNTLVNQLIGTWKNDELEVEFKDVDDMHLRDKTGYRSNEGGTYAVLSEFSIWLISDSSEADILEYSVNGDTLNLNGTILHRDGGTSYDTIQGLLDIVVGTWWHEGITEEYYVFKENGQYEYYATEITYKVGSASREGIYEVIDADEIKIYEDYSKMAYRVIKMNSEGQLIYGSNNAFSKIK